MIRGAEVGGMGAGPARVTAAPDELIAAMRDRDPGFGSPPWAVEMGDPRAVPALRALLRIRRPVRRSAVEALDESRGGGEQALLDAMNSKDAEVRRVLRRLGERN
jgi:hypothetical protein